MFSTAIENTCLLLYTFIRILISFRMELVIMNDQQLEKLIFGGKKLEFRFKVKLKKYLLSW